jgi:hypothetical protein
MLGSLIAGGSLLAPTNLAKTRFWANGREVIRVIGQVVAILPPFPRHLQLPISVGLNLILMPPSLSFDTVTRHARPLSCSADKKWNNSADQPGIAISIAPNQ